MNPENQAKDLATCLGAILKDVEIPSMDQGRCSVAVGQIKRIVDSYSEDMLYREVQEILKSVPAIPENGLSATAVSQLLRIEAIQKAWQAARSGLKQVLA